jgi:hypothetical protein
MGDGRRETGDGSYLNDPLLLIPMNKRMIVILLVVVISVVVVYKLIELIVFLYGIRGSGHGIN